MGKSDQIPFQFHRLHSSDVIVLLDSLSGKVIDVSAYRVSSSEPLDEIRLLAKPSIAIRSLFDIPEGRSLDELAVSYEDPSSVPVIYHSRIGAFDFKDTPEEFHSLLPLATLRLYRLEKSRVLGLIRLAGFFTNLSPFLQYLPLFCADNRERLIGFNRGFLSCFAGLPNDPKGFLGKPLSEFMSPTPGEMQEKEAGSQPSLPESEWKKLRRLPAADQAGPLYITFPAQIRPDEQDIRITFKIRPGSALPAVLIGEAGVWKENYSPDLDGYFLGPDAKGARLVLKKRGNPLFDAPLPPERNEAAEYEFLKSGVFFTWSRNGKRIFSFHDFEGLSKEAARAFFYLRDNKNLSLEYAELAVHNRARPQTALNRFTTLKDRRAQQCHIERLMHLPTAVDSGPFTVFQMRDMTDVRRVITDLEQGYRSALEREKEAVHLLRQQGGTGADFVGSAESILSVKNLAERSADSETTVLIQGETGTGKEMMARFIHAKSPRAAGPFIQVDCSTLPTALIESILFGHEKGAFTGSTGASPGLFRQAEGGTLFLDEIHNLSVDMQAKLLGFLQDQTLIPVGGTRAVKVDVRILVATNLDIRRLVRQGLFREDLYYRIAVMVLELPPLRDRKEDIPALVRHFLDTLNRKYGKAIHGVTPAAYRRLMDCDWPGNIRELKNALERAHVLCDGKEIGEELMAIGERAADTERPLARERKPLNSIRCSKEGMVALLKKHRGYIRKVTEELSVTRQTFYVFCRRHGLKPADYR